MTAEIIKFEKEEPTGFVTGTLVHTDKGLVAIQNIKIGDMVLSSPELDTGVVREYKRVVKTFRAESEEIWQLGFHFTKTVDAEAILVREFIYLTKNHPVYLVDSADDVSRSGQWVSACKLNPDDTILLTTQESDQDSIFYVTCVKRIERIDEHYGFCEEQADFLDSDSFVKITRDGSFQTLGYLDSYSGDYEVTKGSYKDFIERSDEDDSLLDNFYNRKPPCPNLEAPVYTFEVEDCHTYFVGELGLWVHDSSHLGGKR